MHTRRRRNIDDRAFALLLHELTRRRLRAEKHAVEIDSDHRPPSVGRQIHARRRDTRAVIVDQHVEAAEMLDRLGDHLVALVGVADVNRGHLAFAASLADFVADLFEVFDLAARYQHGRSRRRELLGDRLANSGPSTGYDSNLAFDTKRILHNATPDREIVKYIALIARDSERERERANPGKRKDPDVKPTVGFTLPRCLHKEGCGAERLLEV